MNSIAGDFPKGVAGFAVLTLVTPYSLVAEIRSTKFNGISGYIAFDQNGDMTEANYLVKKILGNGKTEEVK